MKLDIGCDYMSNTEDKYYDPFEIIQLEKISDHITNIGRRFDVKINVSLARSVNDNRYCFYTEYEYSINGYKRTSIKRGFDYYLSIESVGKTTDGNKIFVRIGTADFYAFMRALEEVTSWFTDKRWSKSFATKNGNLILTTDRPSPRYITGLPMDKIIGFDLIVINDYTVQPGVRVMIGDESTYADVTVDTIFGLYGALMNFNMFMSAQTMLASLNIPLGTNRVNLVQSSTSNKLPTEAEKMVMPSTSGINGRKIGKPTIQDLE